MWCLLCRYPEHRFEEWRFQVGRRFWDREENAKQFLRSVSKDMGVNTMDDWYSVSRREFAQRKGGPLLRRYGGLLPLLAKYFPEHQWQSDSRGRSHPSKAQLQLFKMLQSMFPEHFIDIEARMSQLIYLKSQREVILDIFIPSLQLAFEYQGTVSGL